MKIAYEKIITATGCSFALLDRRAAVFDGHFHFHPEYEITLIESSSGRRVVGDSIETFAPGDLVLLGGNLPHQYVSNPARPGARAAAKVVQFRRSFAGADFLKMPEAGEIARHLDRSARGLWFGPDTVATARPIVHAVFREAGFARLLRLLDLLRVLSDDARARPIASAGYTARISTREGNLIDQALHYLNQRFAEPVAFADLCRHLNMASATCNRLFRKSVGRSFKAMLNEIRISHACRLLLETDQSIVEIAYASGFANLSNFNRRFKQLKRVTPRAYRGLAARKAGS